MQLWSSIHFFTPKIETALDYCALDIKSERDERTAIDTQFNKYFLCRGKDLDAAPMHHNDRYFIELFEKLYPDRSPSWIIQQDFKQKELHLNLYGDVIQSTSCTSAFSSRYFGGLPIKNLIFHNICDMSRQMRCPVLSHTFTLSDRNIATCKIYIAQGKRLGIIFRSTNQNENVDQSPDLLLEISPCLNVDELLGLLDPLEFSHSLCSSLDIIEGGPTYAMQRDAECQFIKTYKLYDVYKKQIY